MAVVTRDYSSSIRDVVSKQKLEYIPDKATRQALSDCTSYGEFSPPEGADHSVCTELFEKHIGSQWESIFEKGGISDTSVVVEVGPGDSQSKVGGGLKMRCNGRRFDGWFYVVEPEKGACDSVTKAYEEKLGGGGHIVGISKTLAEVTEDDLGEKTRVDCIAANHFPDDHLLGLSLGPEGLAKHFGGGYYDTQEAPEKARITAEAWDSFFDKGHYHLEDTMKRANREWEKFVNTCHYPHLVAVSAYRSHFFHSHSDKNPSLIVADVVSLESLGQTRQTLAETSGYRVINPREIRGGSLLTAMPCWMLMEHNSSDV